MSSPLPLERLMHIRDEVAFLQRCRAKLPDLVALVADEVMSRAIVKSIEIIGEATKTCPRNGGKHTRKFSGATLPGCGTNSRIIISIPILSLYGSCYKS
jgi:hypothetical protein